MKPKTIKKVKGERKIGVKSEMKKQPNSIKKEKNDIKFEKKLRNSGQEKSLMSKIEIKKKEYNNYNTINKIEVNSEQVQERKILRPTRIKKEIEESNKRFVKSKSKKNSLIDDDSEEDDNNDENFEIDSFEEIKVKHKRTKSEPV